MRLAIFAPLILCACIAAPQPLNLTPTPLPTTTKLPEFTQLQPNIDAAIRFLQGQLNLDLELLEESPTIGKGIYYLINDNVLAAEVPAIAGDEETAGIIRAELEKRQIHGNGFVEVAFGAVIQWPPYRHHDHGSICNHLIPLSKFWRISIDDSKRENGC